ncbi:MAG: tetratricopeptide repeat protein [Pseudomonadales bacterium]|nr:tetratricopeptide repeat protein [Pseudomonadales bacterium]
MNRLPSLLALALLGGCSYLGMTPGHQQPTLADLQPATLPAAGEPLPQVSLVELTGVYRDVLEVTDDEATRRQVMHRLADIEMLEAESRLGAGETGDELFAGAIAAYETLLQQDPDNPANDQLLYQLSRAHEMNGDPARSLATLERLNADWPDSVHAAEAQFRRGESYFAAADYGRAEAAYARVIEAGPESAHFANALYMQGWSGFKQGRYDDAVVSFTATLDQLVPEDNSLDGLPRGDQELAQDCLRMLAVVFSYQQGADTIARTYDQLGVRPYQHLLYQSLGELYLSQERYRDSAETYQAYNQRFADSPVAHRFQMQVIAAYEAGGFPDLIVAEKQRYVGLFGVSGPYWQQADESVQDELRPRLRQFIEELAEYHHAAAQALATAGPEAGASDQQDSDRAEQPGDAQARTHYLAASDYYQLFINSFPDDPAVPEMGYQLASSRMEAGEYRAAIASYEWVAYGFPEFRQAADAGYRAILAYEQLPGGEEVDRARIDSELAFATTFPSDPRAATVLAHAADALLALGEYDEAIFTAQSLAYRQPQPGQAELLTASLVMGHSYFELQQHAEAEAAYSEALALLDSQDDRRPLVVDRYAASIYRQGETAAESGEHLQAAEQFSRVVSLAPASAIRASAQYDAAAHFAQAGDIATANSLLVDFRREYPEHELAGSIAAQLVANYEALEQWGAAAAELDLIHGAEGDAETRRQALLLAAQYYERAGDFRLASERYQLYARSWSEPLGPRMEAMNRVAELQGEAGQAEQQRLWLAELVAAHDAAGAARSERSLYLAARASSMLADEAYRRYSALQLTHPLKTSLAAKKAAMEQALAAYRATNDYGVQEYATLATYRMAMIYQQLGADLLASERPADIDELALQQYEMLLEEQAYPFEEKAIAIHEANTRRSWQGVYDEWVQGSFVELAQLMPARYGKAEMPPAAAEASTEAAARLEETLLERLEDEPDDIEVYNRYGIFLRQQGRFEEAEASYLAALEVSEATPFIHCNLGMLYDLYLGQPEPALQHYYRYRDLSDGADPRVALWIADLEQRQLSLVQGGAQ